MTRSAPLLCHSIADFCQDFFVCLFSCSFVLVQVSFSSPSKSLLFLLLYQFLIKSNTLIFEIIIKTWYNSLQCKIYIRAENYYNGKRPYYWKYHTTFILFLNGLCMGASISMGNMFGAKEYDKLHRQISTTMLSGIVFSLVLSILCILFAYPILTLMQVDFVIIPMTKL